MSGGVSVVIPALNEEESIGAVLAGIPQAGVAAVIVVDGGSRDGTAAAARRGGARVIEERRLGYGRACAAGAAAAGSEIVVFLDGDGSDDPAMIPQLARPLLDDRADLVLGSRLAGDRGRGGMFRHQMVGNRVAAALINGLYGQNITDLSPFRGVRRDRLLGLGMTEMTYGWPTEMIVKAARRRWRILEIPVSYRPRIGGESKISGTAKGTILAAWYIFLTVFRHAGKRGVRS
jgi:glycosyltransferase involved in cell wall biosynthesis